MRFYTLDPRTCQNGCHAKSPIVSAFRPCRGKMIPGGVFYFLIGTVVASERDAPLPAPVNFPSRRVCNVRFATAAVATLAILGGLAAGVALAEQVKCEGTITKSEGQRITIKDSGNHDQHMEVVPATKVTVDGKPSKPSDLKTGQHVSCTCDKQGNRMTCTMLEAKTK